MCILHQNERACRAAAHACRIQTDGEEEEIEEGEEEEEEEEETKAMWVCERVACCSAQGYGSQKESVKPGRLQTCDTLAAAQLLRRNYAAGGAMSGKKKRREKRKHTYLNGDLWLRCVPLSFPLGAMWLLCLCAAALGPLRLLLTSRKPDVCVWT